MKHAAQISSDTEKLTLALQLQTALEANTSLILDVKRLREALEKIAYGAAQCIGDPEGLLRCQIEDLAKAALAPKEGERGEA